MATRWRLCLCSLGILLLASCTLSEKFSLSGSSRPVVGIVGQDVVLPCQLSPAARLPRMDLWWRKIGTGFIPVHEYLDEGPTEQAGEGYQNRTELFRQEFSNGNVSLKLKRLQVADGGTYHCFVRNPQWSQEATTELQVAAVAPVFIGILGPQGQGIRLVCRSTGWFPKPELRWVGKNQLNQAMESVTNMTQDRENLYSVVSHVTVIEEDSGDISCIVRNGLLETEQQLAIHLSSEVFPRASPWLAAFWALFVLVLVAAGVCAYCEYTAKQKASQKKSAEQKTFEAEKKALLSDKSKLQENFDVERKAHESKLQELSQKLDAETKAHESKCCELLENFEVKTKDFESERQRLNQTIVSHENQIKRLQSEHEKLNRTVVSQVNEIQRLKSDNQTQRRRLDEEKKAFESECRKLCQKLESQENEIKRLKSDNQTQRQRLDEEKKALESECRELRRKQVPITLESECKHPVDGRTVQQEPPSTRASLSRFSSNDEGGIRSNPQRLGRNLP